MRNQKEEFFELIYAQYAKKLERICLRYVNYQPEYREIAADSVQKTFLKALEEYDKLKDASYIEPWKRVCTASQLHSKHIDGE